MLTESICELEKGKAASECSVLHRAPRDEPKILTQIWMSLKSQCLYVDEVFPPTNNPKHNWQTQVQYRVRLEESKGNYICYTQFSFAFLKGFLKISVQVRLDLLGGPHSLKQLERLLPHAKGLINVLLAHLLTAPYGTDLKALIRSARGWEDY